MKVLEKYIREKIFNIKPSYRYSDYRKDSSDLMFGQDKYTDMYYLQIDVRIRNNQTEINLYSEGCDLEDENYLESLDKDYNAFLEKEHEKEELDEDYEIDEYLEQISDDYNLIGTDNKGIGWWAHESGGGCLYGEGRKEKSFYTATPLFYYETVFINNILKKYKVINNIPFFYQLLIILFLKIYWENKNLEMWSGYHNTRILSKYIKNKEKMQKNYIKE